jgi:trk system potassium uptake protein TrkH
MEWTNPHTLGGESMSTKAAMPLFQGVTPRTAGFQTVSYPEMHEPTLVVQTVLMFIGTAPTSTGGGIKVTTLALVVLIVVAQVRGQDRITLFWRTLPRPLISRALSILAMASLLVLLSTLALMVSDGLELLPALFEVAKPGGVLRIKQAETAGDVACCLACRRSVVYTARATMDTAISAPSTPR